MKKLTLKQKIVAAILSLLGVSGVGYGLFGQSFGLNNCQSLVATSTNIITEPTLTYLTTSGATTTFTCQIGSSESLDLNLAFVATSSSSQINWSYEFSFDGTNYYGEDSKLVDDNTSTVHGNATTTHSWLPGFIPSSSDAGATDSSLKNITITPVASPYIRLNFNVSGANGAFHAQVIKKDLNN